MLHHPRPICPVKHIDQYLNDLIESDRSAQPGDMQALLVEAFALTLDEARTEYMRWLEDVE